MEKTKMNEGYISKKKAFDELDYAYMYGADIDRYGLSTALDVIDEIEPADVVHVVHGKWIDEDPAFAEYFANCSVCGYEIDVHNERGYFNFCPNCGAKMDGEE